MAFADTTVKLDQLKAARAKRGRIYNSVEEFMAERGMIIDLAMARGQAVTVSILMSSVLFIRRTVHCRNNKYVHSPKQAENNQQIDRQNRWTDGIDRQNDKPINYNTTKHLIKTENPQPHMQTFHKIKLNKMVIHSLMQHTHYLKIYAFLIILHSLYLHVLLFEAEFKWKFKQSSISASVGVYRTALTAVSVVEFARQLAQAHESFANQLRQVAQQLVDDRLPRFHLVVLTHQSACISRKHV